MKLVNPLRATSRNTARGLVTKDLTMRMKASDGFLPSKLVTGKTGMPLLFHSFQGPPLIPPTPLPLAATLMNPKLLITLAILLWHFLQDPLWQISLPPILHPQQLKMIVR